MKSFDGVKKWWMKSHYTQGKINHHTRGQVL
jgi:hypothetical protein